VLLSFRKKPLRIVLATDRVLVSDARPVAVEATGEWQPAVQALPAILHGRKGQAAVVLADQFVRYSLLQPNEALKSDEQWLALARHRFTAVHGSRSADWDVKLTETAPSGPRLACAVDKRLIAVLADTFLNAGLHLMSVQPFLIAAFNRIKKQVGDGSCWILVEEPGRLTMALIRRGVWTAIRTRRIDSGWRNALPELLERETAFLGLEERCTRVLVCAQGAFPEDAYEDFRAHALSYPELALAWE
jgi:hypothetical protein